MSELPLPRPPVARESLQRAFEKLPKPEGAGIGPMTFVVSREQRALIWEAIHRARERAGMAKKDFTTAKQVGDFVTTIFREWMERQSDVGEAVGD